jgi:hypothetical protein
MRISWAEAADLSLRDLLATMLQRSKTVRHVTIEDMAVRSDTPSNGVYVFFAGSSVAYVGVAGSRAFIERVPSHFDTRPGAWFGTLLEKLAGSRGGGVQRSDVLSEALDFTICLLHIGSGDAEPRDVEDVLRHTFQPVLNPPKKLRPAKMSQTLRELC